MPEYSYPQSSPGCLLARRRLTAASVPVSTADSAAQQFVAGVCDELGRRQMLRGLGGELMRHALCHLIRKASEAQLPLKNTPTIGERRQRFREWLKTN